MADRMIATADWTRSYDPALRVAAGETVTVGRRDEEWPGWVWCESAAGLGGWLPASGLDARGAAIEAFDTRELTVAAGDALTALELRDGWVRARDGRGEEGWVPASHLRPA